MKEVVGSYTGKKIDPTFFWGHLPNDKIWATSGITIANACIMPAGCGIGDHCFFVINIHTSSLVGQGPPRACRASSRRLNTCLPHVAKKYAKRLEGNILHHRLIQKLGEAHSLGTSRDDTCHRINCADEKGVQYMTHAKRHCQNLKSGRICFSPELVIWIKHKQIYCLLVKYKLGCHRNRGNLK